MRLLRIIAFSVATALAPVAPGGVQAQPASGEAMAAARELFTLMFGTAVRQLNAQAVAFAWPTVEGGLKARNPALDAATLAELRREFERIRLEHLYEVMKDIPEVYVRHLTAEDMRGIIAFYRTPAGGKMLTALPHIMTEGFAAVIPRMPALAADTQEAFLKVVRERGHLR